MSQQGAHFFTAMCGIAAGMVSELLETATAGHPPIVRVHSQLVSGVPGVTRRTQMGGVTSAPQGKGAVKAPATLAPAKAATALAKAATAPAKAQAGAGPQVGPMVNHRRLSEGEGERVHLPVLALFRIRVHCLPGGLHMG